MGKFFNAKIFKDGFNGMVEDIEQGKITKEKLYRIKYDDGDLEHFTAAQVSEYRIDGPAQSKGKAKAKTNAPEQNNSVMKKPAVAVVEDVQEEEEDPEDEPTPVVMRKPAAVKAS